MAVPSVELRSEWKQGLKLAPQDNWRVSTWETSLVKTSRVLVIDEVYKMPRGYLDLSIMADPNVEMVIALGDPLQGEYHSTCPESSNRRLSSEVDRLLNYMDCYCLWTYRVPESIASLMGVKSFNKQPATAGFFPQFDPDRLILCNSISSAKTLNQLGYMALTISSSQGATYNNPITVLVV